MMYGGLRSKGHSEAAIVVLPTSTLRLAGQEYLVAGLLASSPGHP